MFWRPLLPVAALLGLAAAQTKTDCDPMKKDCPPDPALGTKHLFNFNMTPNGQLWETTVGDVDYDPDTGAHFKIEKQGDSPTIRTKFYFFFGRAEMLLKASPGRGIVSSMMLLSDDRDEIDFEFIGSDPRASTNYFGKGIEDYENGKHHDMDVSPQDDYHNYTTVWTKEKLEFYIDDGLVRTVTAEDANNGTDKYPQTPMRMSLGIWAGGDPSLDEWTRKWAGGDTDYDAGPYDMYVKQAYIEDFSSGKEYKWGDRSGSWESIEVVKGNSTALDVINKGPEKPEKSLNEKFNELPQAGKIAIYAGGAAVAAVLLGGLIFYCIKQRRRGAQEARTALQRSEAERMELHQFQKRGIDPDGFAEHGAEYNARDMKSGGMVDSNSYNIPDSPTTGLDNEKQFGAAAVGPGVGVAAVRSQTRSPGASSPPPGSYHDSQGPQSPRSPLMGGFGTPPPVAPMRTPSPGMTRSQSPMMRSPGSPGPQQAYGSYRMQRGPMSPPPGSFSESQGFGPNRMQSPGPYGYRQ